MILNFILLLCMYPMMLVVCYVLYNCAKPQNGIVFGSKLPMKYMGEDAVKQVVERFKKEIKRNAIIVAILPFSAFVTPYVSIQMTIWMVWVLLVIALVQIPYIKGNAAIKNIKRENGWYREESMEEYVEMKAAGEIRCVKTAPFIAPMAVSFLVAATVYLLAFFDSSIVKDAGYAKGFGSIILLFALLNVLIFVVARWMDRQKTEVISTKSDVNVNYTRAKKQIWKELWLAAAWITTGYILVSAVSLLLKYHFEMTILVGSVIYAIALLIPMLWVVKKFREIEGLYEKERDLDSDMDDDRHWIWGTFYYNPSDRHSMVNKRVGVGTTMNLATPVGKGLTMVGALALLSIPLMCAWLIFEEFTPISLSISGDELKAEHLKVEYELQVEDMKEITLIGELPEMSKSVGTAMDNLLKGTFYVYNEGNVEVFLNPQNEVFLKIETGEETYYFGGRTDEETLAVYENLQ